MMPKKKAKILGVIQEVIELFCCCPYCGTSNYIDLPVGCDKEVEYCLYCGKEFIVDLKEHVKND